MAPHLSGQELDIVTRAVARKKSSSAILALITKQRRKAKQEPPKIWAIRRAMAGGTHKRGRPGTRGRKKKLTTVQAQRLFRKRAALLKKAKTEHYVSYGMVSRAARIPAVHETTVGRYLRPFDVMWRRLRL